ncbi:MAG: PKD domain-containing protein [Salibacteraceae bacterium]
MNLNRVFILACLLFALPEISVAQMEDSTAVDSTSVDSVTPAPVVDEFEKYRILVRDLDTTDATTYFLNAPPRKGPLQPDVFYCYTLDASESVDSMRQDLVYEWDLGGKERVVGTVATACFTSPGYHKIWLSVRDTVTGTIDVKVHPEELYIEPNLYFKVRGLHRMGTTLVFDGSHYLSGGTSKSFAWNHKDEYALLEANENENLITSRTRTLIWDFGDGTLRVGSKVPHVFRETGTYRITLTVVQEGNFGLEVVQSCYQEMVIGYNR